MIKKMRAWAMGLEHKAFDKIVSGLTRMEAELVSLSHHHLDQLSSKADQIVDLRMEMDHHQTEATKASSVAAKIGGLIA